MSQILCFIAGIIVGVVGVVTMASLVVGSQNNDEERDNNEIYFTGRNEIHNK